MPMYSFEKKFLLCPYLEKSLHFKLHIKAFSSFARWFCFVIFELNTNTANRYINTSTSINCAYSLACFCFDTNILNKFSCLVCTWFQYLLYKFKRHGKLHLNSHPIQNFLTFASGYPVKFCNFYPHLSLETVSPALKLTQICCINMNISFLENWHFLYLKLAPPLLLTYQA